MKRMLRLVTILMVSVTFLMPLLECFDRWDGPGLSNDTEFPVFVIALLISMVLLALVAIARRIKDQLAKQTTTPIVYRRTNQESHAWFYITPTAAFSPPLRT